MTEIQITQPGANDIFSLGFDKSLNRKVLVVDSPVVYNINDQVAGEALNVGSIVTGGFVMTATKITGPGATSPVTIETHADDETGIKIKSADYASIADGTIELWDGNGGIALIYAHKTSGYLVFEGLGLKIEGNSITRALRPEVDNTDSLGTATFRWSDLRSVLINGADISLANGWKLREYPLKKENVYKPDNWMKEHANQGIQILDGNEELKAVIHQDGYIYCKGFRSLEELRYN